MSPRQHKATFSHWLNYTSALSVIAIVSFVFFMITFCALALFSPSPGPIKDAYARQHDAVVAFTSDDKATDALARQQLAKELISVNRQHVAVEMLKDDAVTAQVRHIAATGDQINLSPKPFSFWQNNKLILVIMGSICYLVIAVLLYFLHLEYARNYAIRHTALPWRTMWPWVLLALSPLLLWPMGLELVWLRQEAKRKAQQAVAKKATGK